MYEEGDEERREGKKRKEKGIEKDVGPMLATAYRLGLESKISYSTFFSSPILAHSTPLCDGM